MAGTEMRGDALQLRETEDALLPQYPLAIKTNGSLHARQKPVYFSGNIV